MIDRSKKEEKCESLVEVSGFFPGEADSKEL